MSGSIDEASLRRKQDDGLCPIEPIFCVCVCVLAHSTNSSRAAAAALTSTEFVRFGNAPTSPGLKDGRRVTLTNFNRACTLLAPAIDTYTNT